MKLLPHTQRCLLLAVVLLSCAAVDARGKEQWITDSWFELSGELVDVRRGSPHAELIIRRGGEHWTARIGAPWRNRRAGLEDSRLAVGQKITVYGYRSSNREEHLVKALRVVVDGRNYDLYPGQIR